MLENYQVQLIEFRDMQRSTIPPVKLSILLRNSKLHLSQSTLEN